MPALFFFVILAICLVSYASAAVNTTSPVPSTKTVVTTQVTYAETTAASMIKKPMIGFSATPVDGPAPLTVTFYPVFGSGGGAPDYLILDFGDGQQVNDTLRTSYQHTYLVSGTYTVALTSVNAGGANLEVKPDYISVQIPAVTTVATTVVTTTAAVTITAVPTTSPTENGTVVTTTVNTTSVPTPTPTEAPPSSPCPFLNQTTAYFIATPTEGYAPLRVSFADSSNCAEPVSWAWDFGTPTNPGIKTLREPLVTYTEPGNYTVSLTVVNRFLNNSTITRKNFIHVLPPRTPTPVPTTAVTTSQTAVPIIPDFSANVTKGAPPLCVQFTDTSTGAAATSRFWNFGDGGNDTIRSPVHCYQKAGTYTVILNLSRSGTPFSLTRENYITVSAPALAIPSEILIAVIVLVIAAVGVAVYLRGRGKHGHGGRKL
jgi:PKD repeat protein